MKIAKSDSTEKSKDLSSNYNKLEDLGKTEKMKEIYFIILFKNKTMEKENDFIFSKTDYEILNIYNHNIKEKRDQINYQKVFKLKYIK